MRKQVLAVIGAAAMSMMMAMSVFAGSWQSDSIGWWYQNDDKSYPASKWEWLDGNNDGTAECYYFDGRGYMAARTITPDGYTVNENGAWTINGVVQTMAVTPQAVSGGNNTAANNQSDRYTVIPYANKLLPTQGDLASGYTFDREHWRQLKAAKTRTREDKYMYYGEERISNTFDYYILNGEEYILGSDAPYTGSDGGKEGRWLVDNTKPDAVYGKTNIRYQFADGSFAGYGFHSLPRTVGVENAIKFIDNQNNPLDVKFSNGKGSMFFSEDGYMYRNVYVDGIAQWTVGFGSLGQWID